MCVSCGCGLPHDDHGDSRNITIEDLQAAADAANETLGCAAHNVESIVMHRFAEKSGETVTVSGTVLKARDEDRFLLMVAYSPNRMPLRGADKKTDLASPRVLEKACWAFMAKGAKTGMWHEPGHESDAVCVENYVYRNPVPWVVNDDLVIKEGDWVVGFVLSERAWDLYKRGLIGGVSMQGGAGRKRASAESLARVRSDAA